jgi:hypothetical protein
MAPALRSPSETGEEGSLLSQFLLTAFDEVLFAEPCAELVEPGVVSNQSEAIVTTFSARTLSHEQPPMKD